MDNSISYFRFNHNYKERVARFLESGALPPEGATLLGRLFTAGHNNGFMLVEANDPKVLFRWTSEWADIIDFDIEPVINDEEAAQVLGE